MRLPGGFVRFIVVCLLFFVSCTDPGETTGVAASTGGVIGAGLGAIVGNQTGNAGSGLVIGAIAGAAAGGLIGNAIEEQQKAISSYDERMQRQHQAISMQRSEMRELRQFGQDIDGSAGPAGYVNKGDYMGSDRHLGARQPVGIKSASLRAELKPAESPQRGRIENVKPSLPATVVVDGASLDEGAPIAGNEQQWVAVESDASRAAHNWESASSQNLIKSTSFETVECKNARDEVQRAKTLSEAADKLFHYRRALRLCPNVAAFHNELGELYLSLDRAGDAEYEFAQALKIDPDYQPAQRNLTVLSNR